MYIRWIQSERHVLLATYPSFTGLSTKRPFLFLTLYKVKAIFWRVLLYFIVLTHVLIQVLESNPMREATNIHV